MKEDKPTLLSKLVNEAIGQMRSLGPADDEGQLLYPTVWEWLTNTQAGDSHVKEPARLTIAAVPGGWLVSLSDSGLAVTVEARADRLDACLVALESALANNTATIRTWGRSSPNLRKKQQSKE